MVLFKCLKDSLANRIEMDWRRQWKAERPLKGVAKVVQVRDDDEFERHSGGIGAINWIWGIMQR